MPRSERPRQSRCRLLRICGLLRDGTPRDTEREAILHKDTQPEGLSDVTLATILHFHTTFNAHDLDAILHL